MILIGRVSIRNAREARPLRVLNAAPGPELLFVRHKNYWLYWNIFKRRFSIACGVKIWKK